MNSPVARTDCSTQLLSMFRVRVAPAQSSTSKLLGFLFSIDHFSNAALR